jgi:uncharacterized damage-inducible protein DinB
MLTFEGMIHPDIALVPPFYRGYVDWVKDYDLFEILKKSNLEMLARVRSIPGNMGEHRYAPDKWSIKELLCHLLDAERIFAYRALRFARNDHTALAGFEEKDYAHEANAHKREIAQIAEEMEHLRQSTIDLFKSFSPEMLSRKGIANGTEISVVNTGFVIPGHETHHRHILEQRYLTI